MGHHFLANRSSRTHDGEVSEWFKEPVLKTGDSERGRGFESHPLRHICGAGLIDMAIHIAAIK